MSNRLKCARKALRYTQQDVARMVGVSQNTYYYWEAGKTNIDDQSLNRLSEIFRVPVDFLLGKKYKLARPFDTWDSSEKDEYRNATPEASRYIEFKHGYGFFTADDVTTITNSVVGDNNTGCCAGGVVMDGAPLGDIEKELLNICSKLDIKRKNALLTRAYELLEE